MDRLDPLRDDLYLLCQYDDDEPDNVRYNALLKSKIDLMTETGLTSAIDALIRAQHGLCEVEDSQGKASHD
jgi:hypothetical protein